MSELSRPLSHQMEATAGSVLLVVSSSMASLGALSPSCYLSTTKIVANNQQSYGVFLSYYLSHATFPEANALDFAFVGGLNFGAAMLVAPVVTGLCQYMGTRSLMAIGAFILGGGFIAASFASQTWHLYLTQGALVGIGVGFVYVPSLPVLSQWFQKRRSLANGISTAGSGIGGLIFSFGTGAMLSNWTLSWALRVIGIVALTVNLLATVFIRDRNAIIRPKQRPFDRHLFMRPAVLWLLAWSFISMLGYITLLYSLSDFAISIGLSSQQAIEVTALLNTGTAVGRPFIGVASDRFGRFNISAGLTFLCGLCCFAIWIPATSYGVALLFAIISGAILGVFWVVSLFNFRLQGSF
jgi:MFS family permease